VVARDYGFAPNPFHGFCTLATCKPQIRRTALVGDWIVGTGSSGNARGGHLVFAMRVTEALNFEDYWTDPRFAGKRPNLRGSTKQAFGDNIYHRDADGAWLQENSHHSFHDGSPNPENVNHDTNIDRVLISNDFIYQGGQGPRIPQAFRDFNGIDLVVGRQGHKCNFPGELIEQFCAWLEALGLHGYTGRPLDW
jgi:Nucleotide modification associated domain 2